MLDKFKYFVGEQVDRFIMSDTVDECMPINSRTATLHIAQRFCKTAVMNSEIGRHFTLKFNKSKEQGPRNNYKH